MAHPYHHALSSVKKWGGVAINRTISLLSVLLWDMDHNKL